MEDLVKLSKRLVGLSEGRDDSRGLDQRVREEFRKWGIELDGVVVEGWRGGWQVVCALPEDVSITGDGGLAFHGVERVVQMPVLLAGLFGIGGVKRVVLTDRLGQELIREEHEVRRGGMVGEYRLVSLASGGGYVDEVEVKVMVDRLMGLEEDVPPNLTYAEANILQRAAEGLPLRRNREVARLVTRGYLKPEAGGFVLTDLGRRALEMIPKMKAGQQWGGPP